MQKDAEWWNIDIMCMEYLDALMSGAIKQEIPLDWEGQEWDNTVLHVSDIGSCPRKVALRFLGAIERNIDPGAKAVHERRMYMAHEMHCLFANVFYYHDILLQYEYPINFREGWSGRCDYIVKADKFRNVVNKQCILDCKTVHPNAFRSGFFPKSQHVTQVSTYTGSCVADGTLSQDIVLPPAPFYVDNGGGSNQHIICWVDDWEKHYKNAIIEAERLEQVRDNVLRDSDNVPDILGKVFKFRSYDKIINLEPDWRCNEPYCSYANSVSCTPQSGSTKMAEKNDGVWRLTQKGKKLKDEINKWLEEKTGEVLK